MLSRATVIWMALALAAALLAAVLTYPSLGPDVSRADLADPALSIEGLQQQVNPGKLPVESAPQP